MCSSTPVVGLGCQSGSYLLYGVNATIVWLLLSLSALLSHRHSLYRRRATKTGGTGRTTSLYVLGALAVLTRLLGKFLAVLNAIYVVFTSVAQFTDLYDTCWCHASVASLGKTKGWVILWATDAQIRSASRAAWEGGTSMGIFSMLIITLLLFWSRGEEIFETDLD